MNKEKRTERKTQSYLLSANQRKPILTRTAMIRATSARKRATKRGKE